MRVGTSSGARGKYALPARNLFDIIATNDVTSLLTLVRGVNPFDLSPGMQIILAKFDDRPESANPFVVTTDELDVDVSTIGDLRDSAGNTALHVAAGCGSLAIAEVLVNECAADVNATNKDGFTPLHLAARTGSLACLQFLLESNAEPLRISGCGRSALFLAHHSGHYAAARCLAPHYADLAARAPGAEDAAGALISRLAEMLRAEDQLSFGFLFDTLDCEEAGCAPLLTARRPPSLDTLRCCLSSSQELLCCLIPAAEAMSPALLFIFVGLLARGVFPAPAAAEDGESATAGPLLTRVAQCGQAEALRLLLSHGYPLSVAARISSADFPAEHPGLAAAHKNLFCLLEAASLKLDFLTATAAYRRKPGSSRRKHDAWEAKVALRTLEAYLKEKNLSPLM